MNLRLLTLVLLAGTALPSMVMAQSATDDPKPAPRSQRARAAAAQPAAQPAQPAARARDSRSQSGLTAAPTDFGRVDIREGGNGTTPGGVTRQDLGGGNMIEEEAVKTRSTVTRDAIDKLSPTANPYQMIQMLPGANVSSVDAFGLVGGNITMRGFNSDQIGMTIEGAPVNDSGNYALFPQEYVDSENMGQVSIAQGAPDLDSPHIGATGGVMNLYMREPSKVAGGLMGLSFGSNNTKREFIRFETGQIGDFRAFASFSHYTGDHWNDPGHNQRNHVDFKGVWEPSAGNRVALSVIVNEATNNSYKTPTLTEFNNNTQWLTALPATFTTGPDKSAGGASNYYGFKINPFTNAIVSLPSTFQITNNLNLDVIPYFWYGYGNGGGVSTMTESTAAGTAGVYYGSKTIAGTNIINVDWNGSGAVTAGDKGVWYNPSITLTHRPGIINKLSYTFNDHKIVGGYWLEDANHKQTAPYAPLGPNGEITDPYLNSGAYVIQTGPYAGQTLQRRDQLTKTMTNMLFLGDTWSIMGDQLALEYGVKRTWIHRRVQNGLPGATPVTNFDDGATLPQIGFRWKPIERHQIFGSLGTSFRSTPNFTLTESFSNGVMTPAAPIPPEKSVTLEFGHRYQGEFFATALSVFGTQYQNHQLSSTVLDPTGGSGTFSLTINTGSVRVYGIDGEIGTRRMWGGWRGYVSGELLHSRIEDNLPVAVNVGGVNVLDHLRTAGKELPRAPGYQAAVGIDYDDDHLFGNLSYKWIGSQFSTLVNDQRIPGFGRVDAAIGYRFSKIGFANQPEFKINFFNILNARNLVGVSGIQSNATAQTSLAGNTIAASGNPTYYLGQGFAAMASMKVGF